MEDIKMSTKVRIRAIILVDGKLLCVRHKQGDTYVALPGGHLEFGEDIYSAMKRELVEELGVTPKLGRLLYIYNWNNGTTQNIEFFIEVTNGEVYRDISTLYGTHSFELSEIILADKSSVTELLPKEIGKRFIDGDLLTDIPQFLYQA